MIRTDRFIDTAGKFEIDAGHHEPGIDVQADLARVGDQLSWLKEI